jgi:Icc-related predicted phosphoesterase
MKNVLLSVADLHFKKPHYAWLAAQAQTGKYDAIVIAGDFLDMFCGAATDLPRQAAWVLDWLAKFPTDRAPLFCVTGNHDEDADDGSMADGIWLQRARRPGVHVDGDVTRHRGLTFACKPWSGPLELSSVAGPVVLVAHGPPEQTFVSSNKGSDIGDFEVRQIAESLPSPADSIVLSGHAHHPDAFMDHVGKVACFNVGCELSIPVPRHLVLDTATRKARIFAGSKLEKAIRY